jgi:uncharacterized protein (DUF1778 family)
MVAQNVKKRPRGRPATGKTPQRQIRCPDSEWELFQRAADAEGDTIAVWLRRVALRAAKRQLKTEE